MKNITNIDSQLKKIKILVLPLNKIICNKGPECICKCAD